MLVSASKELWGRGALEALGELVRVPSLSGAFDPDWSARGQLARAAELLAQWCRSRGLQGSSAEVVTLEGRSPTLLFEVPASAGCESDEPVLLYGHLDKQPPLGDWRSGLAPFEPVREGDRLYGRGAADDGWAVFGAVVALEALEAEGADHARCIVLIEASEESGSPDLPAYLGALGERLGSPGLVIALDSGGPTYDRLWLSSSLRGMLAATVRVSVLGHAVHSGSAGGVVPSSFRLLRQLLSRVESEVTGELSLPALNAPVPADRRAQAESVADELGDAALGDLPLVAGLRLGGSSALDRLLSKTWRPALALTGLGGIPPVDAAGNVLGPWTEARLSVRLPPTCDAQAAAVALQEVLTRDPPQGASVVVTVDSVGQGWDAPRPEPWLDRALAEASALSFGRPHGQVGEGGSIPFLADLAARFPDAQVLATGVLGPASNAHGPDESLHLPTAYAITASLAWVLHAHAHRPS